MMIFDVNTHVGRAPITDAYTDMDRLLSMMKGAGVGKFIVSDFRTAFGDAAQTALIPAGEGLIYLPGITPSTDPGILSTIETEKGIRLYPTYHDWHLCTEEWNSLLDMAQNEGWVVHIYLRLLDPRLMPQSRASSAVIQWLDAQLAGRQNTSFIISGANLSEVQDQPDFFRRNNIWTDTSHIQGPMNSLRKLLDVLGTERVVFGSNTPCFYPGSGIFRIENTPISDSAKELVLGGNAANLFQIT